MKVRRKGRFRSYILALVFVAKEFKFSFLSQISILHFEFIFSIDQIITSRLDSPAQGISGNQNTMSFGQLVPIFFLVLPCFTVLDLYSGEADPINDSRIPQHIFD